MVNRAAPQRGVRLPTPQEAFAGGFVFCIVLAFVVGPLAAAGLLACGMALFVTQPIASLNMLLRYWFVLALPLYCMASSLWSLQPGASLRYAIQLLLTVVFSILVVRHLSVRRLRQITLYILFVLGLLSIGSGNSNPYSGALIGIYGSKNALASSSAVLIIFAVLQAVDPEETVVHRWAGVGAALVGALCVVLAKSAGTWVLVPMVLSVVWLAYLLSVSAPLTRVVNMLIFAVSLAILTAYVLMNLSEIIYFVLTVLQKDITLTGRTLLWGEAVDLIFERPWFGVGYKAFWVQGYGPAEALWSAFGIASRSGFHFHNMYLSNAVEIGLVGLLMQVGLLYGAFLVTFATAVRTKDNGMMLLSALMAMLILQSVIEVPVFNQFDYRSSFVCMALVYGLELRRRRRAAERDHEAERRFAPLPAPGQRGRAVGA